MAEHDLPYRIEHWADDDSRVEELIALASDFYVAVAAYEAAVARRPGKRVVLRQKARVIRQALD